MKENVLFHDLNADQQHLLKKAKETLGNSYSVYSRFQVAAALETVAGGIVLGVNVENAAYGPTICAERSAIASAISTGSRKFKRIAIIARPEGGLTKKATAPCGTCRQVIFEHAQATGIDIEIIMANTNMNDITIATISELLPMAFGPNDLKTE